VPVTEITARLTTALADRCKLERHLGEGIGVTQLKDYESYVFPPYPLSWLQSAERGKGGEGGQVAVPLPEPVQITPNGFSLSV
jgi:hypothetical protein